jgi:hypothetical protein
MQHPVRQDVFASHEYAWPIVKCMYRIYSTLLKMFAFCILYVQVLCQYRLYKADHAQLTYLMLRRQLSNLNGRKLDHRQV